MTTHLKVLIVATLSSLAVISHSASLNAAERRGNNEAEQLDAQGNEFYRSIGKLRGALTCTGAFIATSDIADSPAYVLTNGHCAINLFDKGSANTVTVNKSSRYTINFNYFHDSQQATIPVTLESIVYATMKGVDIAILKTDQTLAQMKQKGLEPYRLGETAGVGEEITISGIPGKIDALQNSQCISGRQVDVVEYNWHWYGLVNNTCAGISSGSSGSPVFTADRSIVGIVNTTSVGAVGETCYSGNPCEVNAGGARINPNHNYVVPTSGLLSCFDKEGEFNLANAGCKLPKPSGIEVRNYPELFALNNNNAHNNWKFDIQATVDKIRVKKTSLAQAADSCQNILGYGASIDASTFHPGEELLATHLEGVHQYCVISANNATAKDPEVIQIIVDNTAPTLTPRLSILALSEDFVIQPIFQAPEYVDYYIGLGFGLSANCTDVEYRQYIKQPFDAPLSLSKICVYGYDNAENKSEVFEYIPPRP